MMKKLKTSNGITLIALVITIIVLLILAGVAISMLSGENGILNQAVRAKEKTEKKSTEEAVQLATLAAMTNTNHGIEEGTLTNELNSYFGENGYTLEGDEENGWTVEVNGRTYTIANNGDMVEKKSFAELKKTGETVKSNTEIVEEDGDKIVIPANFNVTSDSGNTVEEGIVIEDSDKNQYVWIPVFEQSSGKTWGVDYTDVEGKEENSDEYYIAIETALKEYTKDYKIDGYSDVWYGDSASRYGYIGESGNTVYYSNGNLTESEYNNLYHNMLKSVYKNGGFYIGRYEMGTAVVSSVEEAQTNSRKSSDKEYKADSQTPSDNGEPKIGEAPVSKADAVPYNYITQSQAEMLAEKLGEGEDYKNVYTSIMFGVQWDAVCVFIENYDTNNEKQPKSNWLKNSNCGIEWGNYSNSTYEIKRGFYTTSSTSSPVTWHTASKKESGRSWLCTTGASDQNSSLNIYDFGGNVGEWTLERYSLSSNPCIDRGSNYYNSQYASYRNISVTCIGNNVSSRPTLYIK